MVEVRRPISGASAPLLRDERPELNARERPDQGRAGRAGGRLTVIVG
jgi:hypothetical protein